METQNFTGSINLKNIKGAFVHDLALNGSTESCLIIPLVNSGLFVNERTVGLDIFVRAAQGAYGSSHMIKQSFPKEMYQTLSDEQRMNQPILGNLKVFNRDNMNNGQQRRPANTQPPAAAPSASFPEDDNAPF